MTFQREFAVVDAITRSQFPTHGVDAFSLSIIKMERQLRKLFTYLVFQSPAFGPEHIGQLREVLGASKSAYYEGFELGINALYRASVEDMVGAAYVELRPVLDDARDVRNKIFHGQLTERCLQREGLAELSDSIRRWCFDLATGASAEVGYDGFERPSFRKGPAKIADGFQIQIQTPEEYRAFIRRHVNR
ncbi:hypothetical protein [Burkholderia gladioli]|uniref:hypothetical protein n=1 Tax=Burkholderia gladioli TaxID=28095 RepID=UPI00163E4BCA|nr:hypothetical protein [Burkholderia gladioli]